MQCGAKAGGARHRVLRPCGGTTAGAANHAAACQPLQPAGRAPRAPTWLAAWRSGTERSTLTPRVARKRGSEASGPMPSIKPCRPHNGSGFGR